MFSVCDIYFIEFHIRKFEISSSNQLKYLNRYSKACKESSVSPTYAMLSSILNNVKGKRCKQSSARVRVVDKYQGRVYSKLIREESLN